MKRVLTKLYQNIASRKSRILMLELIIFEQGKKLIEQDKRIIEQDERIAERELRLSEQELRLSRQELRLCERVKEINNLMTSKNHSKNIN